MTNVEAIVVAALRAAGVCGGRVHVDVPANVVYPAGRVTRIGGGVSRPAHLDRALLQVEFWGAAGPSGTDDAFNAAAGAVVALSALKGSVASGVVAGVVINSIGNVFDTTFSPARARRIITVTVTTHP